MVHEFNHERTFVNQSKKLRERLSCCVLATLCLLYLCRSRKNFNDDDLFVSLLSAV